MPRSTSDRKERRCSRYCSMRKSWFLVTTLLSNYDVIPHLPRVVYFSTSAQSLHWPYPQRIRIETVSSLPCRATRRCTESLRFFWWIGPDESAHCDSPRPFQNLARPLHGRTASSYGRGCPRRSRDRISLAGIIVIDFLAWKAYSRTLFVFRFPRIL